MQLKTSPGAISICEGLAAAACALIGVSTGIAHAGEIDSAVLLYSEAHRVTVLEGTAKGRHEVGPSGQAIGFHLIFDALTGASANGATPAGRVQTFTAPSGRSSYTTLAGQTPLNTTFSDTRVAGGASWEQPIGRLSKETLGLDLSWERDYTSIGVSSLFTRDLFHRNTTLTAGAAASWDRLSPIGGVPIEGSSMPPPSGEHEDKIDDDDEGGGAGAAESKTAFDFIAGLTQVVNRFTIVQLNYSRSLARGYLTDPYKITSVFANAPNAVLADPTSYRFEKRPDSRTKNALFAEMKHHFANDVVDLSYRYLWDEWGIRSHTLETRYRWNRAGPNYWEPHVRLYRQDAADFFAPFLDQSKPMPQFFSADYRLAKMSAFSVGLRRGWTLSNAHTLGTRLEYYEQRTTGPDATASPFDLYPTVRATIAQLDYSFDW